VPTYGSNMKTRCERQGTVREEITTNAYASPYGALEGSVKKAKQSDSTQVQVMSRLINKDVKYTL